MHDFRAVAGSVLDQLEAGAALTRTPQAVSASADFHVVQDAGNAALHHFDATFGAAGPGGLAAGTQFLWDFGNGVTATGAGIDHSFAEGGSYTVKPTTTLPGGWTQTRSVVVDVEGPGFLTYGAESGFVASQKGRDIVLGLDGDANPHGLPSAIRVSPPVSRGKM